MAQQATSDAQSVQRIEITGSNIRRADKETPSPVQVITADDLKKSGYTSVSDVLRDITANGQGTLSQSFNRAFAGGAAAFPARLDGRRNCGVDRLSNAGRTRCRMTVNVHSSTFPISPSTLSKESTS